MAWIWIKVECIKKPVDIKMRGLAVGICSKVRTKWRLAAWFWRKMSICRQSNFDSSPLGSWEKYNFVYAVCKSTRTQIFYLKKSKNASKIHSMHFFKELFIFSNTSSGRTFLTLTHCPQKYLNLISPDMELLTWNAYWHGILLFNLTWNAILKFVI